MDATLSTEEQFLAESAARVAGDLRKATSADGTLDAEAAWAALDASGLVAMRAEPEAAERASAVDVAVCLEAFGAQASPAPLLGPLLAVELLRLAGSSAGPPGEGPVRPTIALSADLSGIGGPDAPGSLAFDALGATVALGLRGGAPVGAALGATAAPRGGGSADEEGEGARGSADLTRVVVPVEGFGAAADGAALSAGALAAWRAFALVAVCADMVGAMQGALTMAVEYARQRRQFSKPIGSFQAIQHLCAEQHVSIEASRSVTYWAAWAVDAGDGADALHAATVAKAYVARVARPVTEAVLQVHGGIGHTWECEAHRYLRRVLVDRAVLGDEHVHEVAVAAGLLSAQA